MGPWIDFKKQEETAAGPPPKKISWISEFEKHPWPKPMVYWVNPVYIQREAARWGATHALQPGIAVHMCGPF